MTAPRSPSAFGGLVAALAALAAAAPPAMAGDGSFPTVPPGSPYPYVDAEFGPTALGDIDADGNADVVAIDAGGVNVRLGAGDGTFPTAVPGSPLLGSTVGNDSGSLVLSDLNADGNLDLAVASFEHGNVHVRLGNGDGAFPTQPAGTPVATGDVAVGIAAGDVNGDGIEDLAVTSNGQNQVSVLLGDGLGGFPTQPAGSPYPSPFAWGVLLEDFDSDGDEDMAVTDPVAPEVRVRLNAGDGSFGPATPYAGAGNGNTSDLAAGDLNADGAADLVAGQDTSGDSKILLGEGDGGFQALTGGPGTGAGHLAVADFDADGDEDLVSPSATVRLGNGDGTFGAGPAGTVGIGFGNSVAVGDLNSDGNDDLAAATNGDISIRLGAGTAWLADSLIAGGGMEGAGAARTLTQFPALPSPWLREGQMTRLRYGATGFPDLLDAPRYATGGLNLFWGGPAPADSAARQTVSVASQAASIDAGLASVELSAYLGGLAYSEDAITATAQFVDGAGDPLGAFSIGPVSDTDRNHLTTLMRRAGSQPVPLGTRSIRLELESVYADGPRNDGLADNVKLTIDAPDPPPTPPPPPASTDPSFAESCASLNELLGEARGHLSTLQRRLRRAKSRLQGPALKRTTAKLRYKRSRAKLRVQVLRESLEQLGC